jgi:uncharacterized RDD family membrane protein YckC
MTAGEPLDAPVAPSIRRRLACMVYESVLLFGVVMTAGYLYSSLTQQRHALQGSTGLQLFLFIVLGIYFAGFWSRSGQTLAMKTWHIRLQTRAGGAPSQARAFARYAASWLWFLPALASTHFSGIRSTLAFVVIVVVGMLAYAMLARLRTDRQFLHDALCGTQLVDSREMQPAPAQSVS